jgi:hypothetical protein
MTNFLHWRKMTWVIAAWTAGVAVWLLSSAGLDVAIVTVWLVVTVALSVVWFGTRPLFRQGRGLSFRRYQIPLAP